MATHKSALKRAKQSNVRSLRNTSYRSRAKRAIKDVRAAVADSAPEQAREQLNKAVSIIQKSTSKGVIHQRNASRRISRLARQVNQLTST